MLGSMQLTYVKIFLRRHVALYVCDTKLVMRLQHLSSEVNVRHQLCTGCHCHKLDG